MTITLAMHGTNSVMVTIATSSCASVRFIVKKPAAPKSRRTKPMTNAVGGLGGQTEPADGERRGDAR